MPEVLALALRICVWPEHLRELFSGGRLIGVIGEVSEETCNLSGPEPLEETVAALNAQAAKHFRQLGFREVYNVTGGIDAWADVDTSIPKY